MGLFASIFKLWDGTNTATVKPGSTPPAAGDTSLVVGVSPNLPATDNSTNGSKLPVIAARANAANPGWTETNQVPLSVDLTGNNRTLINSWFGSSAPTVGSKTSVNSIPVVIASDQGTLPIIPSKAGTSTLTGVAASASSVTLLASNTSRLGATITNDTSSSTLYVRLGSTAAAATSGNYTIPVLPGSYYEVPFAYDGAITGIWSAATGFANVDELTA